MTNSVLGPIIAVVAVAVVLSAAAVLAHVTATPAAIALLVAAAGVAGWLGSARAHLRGEHNG